MIRKTVAPLILATFALQTTMSILCAQSLQIAAAKEKGETMKDEPDGRRDFDFLFGKWNIRNRRLARRLESCTEWQEFSAAQEVRPVLGGLGNIDKLTATFPDGKAIEGMTLRFFDPKAHAWSLYWIDNWTCQLQPPVVGRFVGNRGEFYGDDTFKEKPIRVRFIWVKNGPDSAHWEQAFSDDGGKTWETNWEMEMTRVN